MYSGESEWRLGDGQPWALKGQPAAVPKELQLPADQQATWRRGDDTPFRLDGEHAQRSPRDPARPTARNGLFASPAISRSARPPPLLVDKWQRAQTEAQNKRTTEAEAAATAGASPPAARHARSDVYPRERIAASTYSMQPLTSAQEQHIAAAFSPLQRRTTTDIHPANFSPPLLRGQGPAFNGRRRSDITAGITSGAAGDGHSPFW